MTPALRLALRLVRCACHRAHREEIEGDLLELHALRRLRRGSPRAEREVLWEALRSIVGRPSHGLQRRMRFLALVLAAGGVGVGYLMLVIGWKEPGDVGWAIVVVVTALELLVWFLLLLGDRGRVEQSH